MGKNLKTGIIMSYISMFKTKNIPYKYSVFSFCPEILYFVEYLTTAFPKPKSNKLR